MTNRGPDPTAIDLTLRSMAALAERAGRSVQVRNEEHERPLAIQYALYQLLKDTLKVATPQGVFRTSPYLYNTDDFDGRRDWSGQFVTSLLESGRGTCRSLPYLYQMLSERLGVESWLAFAPSHVYVKHRDAGRRSEGWQQRMHNVELTNGSFPTDGWLMASGYITLKAIQHGLFMRKLTAREAVAQCAVDLAGGYARKTGRLIDGFAQSCATLALSVDTLNPNARLLEIRVARAVWEASGKKTDLAKLESLCRRLAALGYREMPAQMYLNWLFELRTAKNPLDSVRYRPKRFPKPDSLNGLPVLTLTDGYFDEFPDWADSTRMAGVVFDLKKKKIAGIVHEPDSLRRGESWTPTRWLSTDPIHHPYQSPYAAFDGNPIFFVDPNGTSVGDYYLPNGKHVANDGIDDDKVYVVQGDISDIKQNPSQEEILTKIKPISVELGIGHKELLNRARWAYGESGGSLPLHYAWAINNFRERGSWPTIMGQEIYEQFSEGTYADGNQNYSSTNPIRNEPEKLNLIENYKNNVAGIISQQLGTPDPTNGAWQWRGGVKLSSRIAEGSQVPGFPAGRTILGLQVHRADGRYHYFFNVDLGNSPRRLGITSRNVQINWENVHPNSTRFTNRSSNYTTW